MKSIKTFEEFKCDVCGKSISMDEANPEISWTRGWFGADCPNYGRVIVQDYVSYGHTFDESNLCYECKKKFLEKALSIVNEKLESK